ARHTREARRRPALHTRGRGLQWGAGDRVPSQGVLMARPDGSRQAAPQSGHGNGLFWHATKGYGRKRQNLLNTAQLYSTAAVRGPRRTLERRTLSVEPTIVSAPGTLATQTGEPTPTATQSVAELARRRWVFAALCSATTLALGLWLATILAAGGFGALDALMV